MSNLIFFQPHNRPFRTDGDEFTDRALDAVRYYEPVDTFIPPMIYDVRRMPKGNDLQKRRHALSVLQTLQTESVDRLLIFAHGTQKWCEFGGTVSALPLIAPEIKRVMKPDGVIGLYCCLTGNKHHGGFAHAMNVLTGLPVLANASSSPWALLGGHTTRNPYKVAFVRGERVELWPAKPEWKEWSERLKNEPGRPFEILEEVRGM
jgi:hypothetical protein